MPQPSCLEKTIHDPVLSACEFPLAVTLYPYGFPLELETNSQDVIDAASEGWGLFEQAFDESPVRLSIGVSDAGAVLDASGDPLPQESVCRSREHMLSIVADSYNFVVCDFNLSFAFGWVTQNTAADHPLLRYRFLVAAAATLIEQRGLAAMHGALVQRNGTGLMLAGNSFAGKSTLAYACARSGWTYVSDDGALVVRGRDDRYAVGDPHSIRFRPDAPRLFPELAGHLARIRPNGKLAIEVRTRELGLGTAPGCHVEHVVYLNRGHVGQAHLRRFSKEQARGDLSQYAVYGTKEVREAQRSCRERILSAQLWEMQYSDLDAAVARLERLVDSGG